VRELRRRLGRFRLPGWPGHHQPSRGVGAAAEDVVGRADYQHDGFFAKTRAEEKPCPDLELKVLWSTENVTAAVNAAIDPKATVAAQNAQRKAALARLEQEATKKSGLKTETVDLYQGGECWLYGYKTYKDIRLVCAPEEQIAFFGGDPDNFTFPRYNLDYAFSASTRTASRFVRSTGSPGARTAARRTTWCSWPDTRGARTAGARSPSTSTSATSSGRSASSSGAARGRAARVRGAGPRAARQASSGLRGLENNLKRERGFLELLRDPAFLAEKRAAEQKLRTRVNADVKLASSAGGAWDRIAAAAKVERTRGRARLYHDITRVSRLLDLGNGLVRMTAEVEKPNEQRFKEYREANLTSQRFQLLSPAPVYPAMEEAVIAARLQLCLDSLGAGDAWVKAALDGRSPKDVAHELAASKLGDVPERKRLLEGGRAAVEASTDPVIAFARRTDAAYREERKWYEDSVESVETLEGTKIAKAVFALDGRNTYPDATGSLRLSYGKAAGYQELGTRVPWQTRFYGLYDRAQSFDLQAPYDLPERIRGVEKTFDLSTPFNFASTNDIIGGNSGSPVLDRDGRYVGLVFDGNIQGFAWEFGYTDTQARCVSVDSRAIIESLRHIYGMTALADEITSTPK
jgi:hypothetical protein